eukprot:TRINITY_DN750_c0_g1_i2.p1 TRINITY_DN750_c0_g1~~TRINITY_DN750_c0_g1_i2.p1  ORF type:complete len:592 (+),score=149.28 TRINITY_DN750_c0_g1_i2:77-1852(+)
MRAVWLAALAAWAADVRARTENAGAPDPNVSSAVISTWGSGYDKTRAPKNVTLVKISATINKITGLSEKTQEYGLNFYFRQMWQDSRLQWDPDEFDNITELTHVPSQALWTPDTFFVSANRAESFEEFTIVKYDGSVAWSARFLVTFFCSMDFQYYPFDVQNCTCHLESYGYSPDVLVLEPAEEDTRPWNVGLDVSEVDVKRVGVYMLTGLNFRGGMVRYHTLYFSRVTWGLTFSRSWSRYLLTTFVPLWLVVALSCIGSWISPDAAPARVAMGITTVLVLITLMYTLTRSLPETNKATAMDMYFVLCIVVVAGNMAEYALVNNLLKALSRRDRYLEGRRKHLHSLLSLVRKSKGAAGGEGSRQADNASTGQAAESDPPLPRPPPPSPEDMHEPKPKHRSTEPVDTAQPGRRSNGGAAGVATELPVTSPASQEETPLHSGDIIAGPQHVDLDELLETQRAELREVFLMFDQDRSGEIDCHELRVIMETIGANEQEVQHMMTLFDRDNSGTLDFQEFAALLIQASALNRSLQFHPSEVRAITFCRAGVTHSSIDQFEHIFRCTVPAVFTVLSGIWFMIIAINMPEEGQVRVD